jgi:tryptophanyl-tRNA synthetase
MPHTPKHILLTGDRPTGKLHLGHFVGSIQNRVSLQGQYDKAFYMVADVQALTDNADNPDKVRSNVLEVVLDNMACGLDPAKTIFFIQSEVPEIAELTIYFLNLVTLARLKRNPTVKDEMTQKGYGEDVAAGFLIYPVSQAADILAFKANVVPVGVDQVPHIEQGNELAHKFNTIYNTSIFPKIEAKLSETPRLVGIDGNSKMSKSLGNTINFSDTNEEIEAKVKMMYTDPGHIHVEDPGEVLGNVVFNYLDIFDPNKAEVAELKAQYQKGGLGDMVIKKRLTGILQEMITPIRERREYLARDPKHIMDILEAGTEKARETARETLREVKEAMKINYF